MTRRTRARRGRLLCQLARQRELIEHYRAIGATSRAGVAAARAQLVMEQLGEATRRLR